MSALQAGVARLVSNDAIGPRGMTQFGGSEGGAGLERGTSAGWKRGGSGEDGGVIPLKVKTLYYPIYTCHFALSHLSRYCRLTRFLLKPT